MLIEILLLFVGCFSLCYLFVKKRYSHWRDRGVPYFEPIFPQGSIKGVGTEFYRNEFHKKMYDEHKGKSPFVGFWSFLQPELLIIDINIIKNILVKDFSSFVNRGIYYNAKDDPLSAGIFSLDDDQWRHKRSKLAPSFSWSKIKEMFPTINKIADEFMNCINSEIKKSEEIECSDLLGRFMVDVIGSVAFGVECNSMKDPDAEFREMGRRVFQVSKRDLLKFLFLDANKGLARKLRVTTTRPDVSEFFINTVRDTIAYRETNMVNRSDLMQRLIKLKNDKNIGMTINEIAAEAFLFFLGGYETSANLLSFALYVLAQQEEFQVRGRNEINDIVKKYGGELTFESISEMKYVGQIIDETLRVHSPGVSLARVASADYKIEGTNLCLKKGAKILISIYSIHHDPEYYPEPEKFDPDRFTPEEVAKRNPFTYMPFGDGPRNCIGRQLALLQTKIALVHLLKNFKFSTCSKTTVPAKYLPNARVLTLAGGLWLNVQKI